MQATIADPLPVALPVGQGASLTVDRNGRLQSGDQPFSGGVQLTPNDGVDVTEPHRALFIGTGGTLSAVVLGANGTTRNTITTTVGDGSVFPFKVVRLNATGTTAGGIVAGW